MLSNQIVKISVLTATYNAAEHLPRLMESLRAQTDRERRALAAPLRQLLAEDQGVVAQAQQVIDFVIHDCALRAYRFLTSSGIGKKVGWR